MKFFTLALLLFCVFLPKTQVIKGFLQDDEGKVLSGVLVFNLMSKQETRSKEDGSFEIDAKPADILRMVDFRIDRQDFEVLPQHFNQLPIIQLHYNVRVLKEVRIGFKPSGNLERDVKRLQISKDKLDFQNEMANITKTKPTGVIPTLSMPRGIAPNLFEGQGNILGLAIAAYKLIKKMSKPMPQKANYYEKNDFQKRMKTELNFDFFKKYSLDEYELDIFIAYCDEVRDLSKTFRNNFDKRKLQEEMERIFKSYQTKLKS